MNDSSRNRSGTDTVGPVKEKKESERARPQIPRSTAFLVTQVGAHAAARFGERLKEVDFAPPQAGILRNIAVNPGSSQQALAERLGMAPSRMVTLLDELQARGLVERRHHPDDRRLYALHLTDAGAQAMAAVGRVARAHDDDLLRALDAQERQLLGDLLARVAEDHGLSPGVHPGFARMGEAPATQPAASPAAASASSVRPRARRR